jgi:hypothetical protein
VYKVLVGKSEGKRPLGRPTHRWDQWGDGLGVECIHLAQNGGPVAGSCERCDEHSGSSATELLSPLLSWLKTELV